MRARAVEVLKEPPPKFYRFLKKLNLRAEPLSLDEIIKRVEKTLYNDGSVRDVFEILEDEEKKLKSY